MVRSPTRAWHALAADEALRDLASSVDGLSADEAARRLAEDGPNELTETKRVGALRVVANQFKSLFIWILIAAGAVSGALGEAVDALVILAIVVLNAAIGFYQELNAERAVAALKKMTAPHAKVRRDGAVSPVLATQVVVGDVLVLDAGDLIAADGRLFEAASLACVESSLTGESLPAAKSRETLDGPDAPIGDRDDMVFMGTSVATGTGQAVVVAVGMKTELGHIAGLIEDAGAEQQTPLQKKLDAFGRILVWVTVGIIALLFILGLLRGMKPAELFMTSVSLAVAAVPEGLPAVVTVALALGVLRMSRRRALVRRLPAVETLGATSVICTDKTGTLTVGEMTVRALYVSGNRYEVTGNGYGPTGEVRIDGVKTTAAHAPALRELATALLACNNARVVEESGVFKIVGDPTEGALLVAAHKAGGDEAELDAQKPAQRAFPFDSDRKRSSVVRGAPNGTRQAFVLGAPGPVLKRCTHLYSVGGVAPLTAADRKRILDGTSAMAKGALRVLASAYRDLEAGGLEGLTADAVERGLVFVGLAGMMDPPRAEAKGAISKCHDAGIRVVMITGDHPDTAAAIALDLGIATGTVDVATGAEVDAMSEQALAKRVPAVAVYARVTAEHKLRIVRALKAQGAVVAMTGDGVNDAPAIKGADIGIAMGASGTEVTKQAADIIIADDNFATIVAAVEEGRGIYENIRKTLQYLLAGNTGELLFVGACVVIGLPMPLLPIQLLWVNLVSDGLPAMCLAADPIDPDVMKHHPRAGAERIANPAFLRTMFFTGLLTATVSFATYWYVLRTGTVAAARTSGFAVLVFAELLRSFGARSETKPIWRIVPFANGPLLAVVAISIGLQVWSQHSLTFSRFLKTAPISYGACLSLFAVAAIPTAIVELVKVARNRANTAL